MMATPAWQTVARAGGSPYATCYMLESNPVESVESSIEQSVDCSLLPTAARLVVGSNYAYFGIQLTWICCTGATWFHSFSPFPLPTLPTLPAPIHLQFSLLSVLTDDCVLWQLMSVSAIRGPRKNSEHCSLPKSIWPSGQRNVKYQGI